MILTKGIISRDEAFKLAPDYVAYNEGKKKGDYSLCGKMLATFESLKKGQACITLQDGQYVKCKVSKVDHNSCLAVDGPLVRISNGEYSWRVDGCDFAAPI